MDTYTFREQPQSSDVACVASILHTSGFFNEEEQQVGVSLVTERLEKGEVCEYFFQFAECGSEVRGYTCFGPIPGTKSSYDLYWIAVDMAFRGKGLGTKLLVQTELEIDRRGGNRVYIETSSTELYFPTRSFYERNGYLLEAELKDYYAPGDNKLIYVKAW
ncbi:GNAT family N-acetyltransferase [Sphaerochaeta sp. PS]|uniref:GNAT family N-acetyltransferase n=1 Tax=Sphaerochaeta sp. PS TaxID=3076336 RepID=UPI0028A50C10|nr:GNAT family N-acetyltransferase [Sphaerochaeta sp. PS]MDT4761027.1 GNAT family N-acetyltransferase [Sphaerochaeta sp. PS]